MALTTLQSMMNPKLINQWVWHRPTASQEQAHQNDSNDTPRSAAYVGVSSQRIRIDQDKPKSLVKRSQLETNI